jgi:putative FmdB family regulatory protein
MLGSAMPIYEYRCDNGHLFEVMQKMTDDPASACTICEAPVQRVFHPVAVHFKGKGFYNTDYGTRRRNRELERSGKSGSDKGGSDKSGSDSSSSSSSSDGSSSSSSSGSGESGGSSKSKSSDSGSSSSSSSSKSSGKD